jgi:hypothetical protein
MKPRLDQFCMENETLYSELLSAWKTVKWS